MEKNSLVIPDGYVVNSDFEFQGGYSAMTELLALQTPPQAVFASNDAMAVGVYHALFQAGCAFRRISRSWDMMILSWRAI